MTKVSQRWIYVLHKMRVHIRTYTALCSMHMNDFSETHARLKWLNGNNFLAMNLQLYPSTYASSRTGAAPAADTPALIWRAAFIVRRRRGQMFGKNHERIFGTKIGIMASTHNPAPSRNPFRGEEFPAQHWRISHGPLDGKQTNTVYRATVTRKIM